MYCNQRGTALFLMVSHCYFHFSIRVLLQEKRNGSPLELIMTTTTMTKVGLLPGGLLV